MNQHFSKMRKRCPVCEEVFEPILVVCKRDGTLLVPIRQTRGVSTDADLDKWVGSYSCNQTDFVTVKRLVISKEHDGKLKIRGALVGFPDEVSIGEATPELYWERASKDADVLLAHFSSDKYTPFMVITRIDQYPNGLNYLCYMTDVDGSKVYFSGLLSAEIQ